MSRGEDFLDSAPETIYLDGNSLGRPPRSTAAALAHTVAHEWGRELVDAWEHWIDLPRSLGDTLARELLGAPPGSVVLSDSTTVNFYKLACAALDARPSRDVIVTDRGNFPTNRYVVQGLAAARGGRVRWIDGDSVHGPSVSDVAAAIGPDTALVTLSHVAYRSAAIADMAGVNQVALDAGALTLWDLSHSVGAIPIDLAGTGCDLAVGCTYKYLNGGPGSPAFLFVRPEHQAELRPPIWGWFGQRDQFAMGQDYEPMEDIGRFLAGTPPVIALVATASGVRSVTDIGIQVLRERSVALTEQLIAETDRHLGRLGFRVGSPRDWAHRGGHVLLRHADARRISIAMRRFAGVVGDFRAPDGLRLAPVAAYVTSDQVSEAVRRIAELVGSGRHETVDPSRTRVS